MPDPVVFGTRLLVEGKLAGIPFDNEERRYEVELQVDPFPYSTDFRKLGEPELTNGAGGFSFSLSDMPESAELRVVLPGTVVASPMVLERVAVRVSLHARASARHGYVLLYGTVSPAQSHAVIGFQRVTPGQRSVNEGGAQVRKAAGVSNFSRVLRVPPGLYQALAVVSNPAYVSNYSSPITIR